MNQYRVLQFISKLFFFPTHLFLVFCFLILSTCLVTQARNLNCLKISLYFSLCGLAQWFSGKEPTCPCRRCRFDPWVRKIPWRRKWQPTVAFLPGKFQRGLAGYSPWSRKRVRHNQVTKQQISLHSHHQSLSLCTSEISQNLLFFISAVFAKTSLEVNCLVNYNHFHISFPVFFFSFQHCWF